MLATLILSLAFQTAQPDRFTVYLSAPMRNGFADTSKAIEDSIKDIEGRINAMKEMQVVDRREKADIVLTVIARGVGPEPFRERLNLKQYYRDTVLTTSPIAADTWWVASVIEVDKYRREFIGAYTNPSSVSMGTWGFCAQQIASNLRSWALANTRELRQRRIKK